MGMFGDEQGAPSGSARPQSSEIQGNPPGNPGALLLDLRDPRYNEATPW